MVEYLREKHNRESHQRKEELELRKMEQRPSVELEKQQHDMRLFMQQQQQQTSRTDPNAGVNLIKLSQL